MLGIYDKKSKKTKKGKQTLGDLINDYITKVQHTYYQQFCEEAIKNCMRTIMEGYNKKIENFLEYNDQEGEFELMLVDSTSNIYFIIDIYR